MIRTDNTMRESMYSAMNVFVLAIILGIGILSFLMLSGNRLGQLIVGFVIAASYASWGLLHHWIIGDFHRKIVLEYVLVGAIAVSMFIIILGT